MKSKAIIIVLLIVAQIGAFTLKSYSQPRAHKGTFIAAKNENKEMELIGDETTLSYMKNDAKIETYNDSIFNRIIRVHQQLLKRYTCTCKNDKRYGSYKYYVIYLNKEDAEIIRSWAKINL